MWLSSKELGIIIPEAAAKLKYRGDLFCYSVEQYQLRSGQNRSPREMPSDGNGHGGPFWNVGKGEW